MARKRLTALALLLTTGGATGCGGPASHPIATADQAIVVAHEMFRGSPQGHGPFRATRVKDTWAVTSGSGEDQVTITIDGRTGRGIGFYQTVHINEAIDHDPAK